MAVGKGKEDDLEEAYELLGVEEDADDKAIQSAYRKLSLKVHPDRNPDDPEAPAKFDQLTRAKDLLVDPARRAELDRKRKAARDLEERFAAEDSKRRKMREDLEGREAAFASGKPRPGEGPSPAELKKRAAQMDYSARLKAKQAEMAERQNEVVSEAVESRSAAEEARLKITWRAGGTACSVEVIRKALHEFDVVNIELSESGGVAQLRTREDALRAVLECRQRKHQIPFRVALATTSKASDDAGKDSKAPSMKRTHTAPAVVTKGASFDDFEAKMFADLQNLAKKQKVAKSTG
jgi:curved DNA-binding protein CbpA